jgi:hypothetical protein
MSFFFKLGELTVVELVLVFLIDGVFRILVPELLAWRVGVFLDEALLANPGFVTLLFVSSSMNSADNFTSASISLMFSASAF